MNTLYLEVTGDTNDGDYVSNRSEITKENLELLMPLIKAIGKKRKENGGWGHNWITTEYRRDDDQCPSEMYSEFTVDPDTINDSDENDWKRDLVGWFEDEYAPHGIHSITSIVLIEVVSEKNLM